MDRVTYSQQVATRLDALRAAREARKFPEPSTRAAASNVSDQRRRNDELLDSIRRLLTRVDAAKTMSDNDFEAERREIDRELSEVEALAMSL